MQKINFFLIYSLDFLHNSFLAQLFEPSRKNLLIFHSFSARQPAKVASKSAPSTSYARSLLVFLILIAPSLSFAESLVQCDNSVGNLCDFNALMALVNRVIHFVLFNMVIPIAAIMFVYAGFLMITAGGEAAGARTKAKSIFTNVVIGLIIAIAAFLIIRTILSILGYEGSWIGFNPISSSP